MPFPPHKRVIYSHRTLIEVVCQLRFPRTLEIETGTPARFQRAIRREYPRLEEKREALLPADVLQSIPAQLRNTLPSLTEKKAYDFTSRDGQWTVGLSGTFLALVSRSYERWEGFRSHLEGPLDALVEVYEPAFFTRIGLRYRNIIRRSELGLTDTPWSELLNPYVAGALAAPDIPNRNITGVTHRLELELADGNSFVRIVHGLATVNDDDETCYLIDSDFFTEQETEVADAMEKLNYFNRRSGRLFRWFISDRLDEALGPNRVDSGG